MEERILPTPKVWDNGFVVVVVVVFVFAWVVHLI